MFNDQIENSFTISCKWNANKFQIGALNGMLRIEEVDPLEVVDYNIQGEWIGKFIRMRDNRIYGIAQIKNSSVPVTHILSGFYIHGIGISVIMDSVHPNGTVLKFNAYEKSCGGYHNYYGSLRVNNLMLDKKVGDSKLTIHKTTIGEKEQQEIINFYKSVMARVKINPESKMFYHNLQRVDWHRAATEMNKTLRKHYFDPIPDCLVEEDQK